MYCCCNLTRNPPAAFPLLISSSSSSSTFWVRVSRRTPMSSSNPSDSFSAAALLQNSETLHFPTFSSSVPQVRPITSSSPSSFARSLHHRKILRPSNPSSDGFHHPIANFPTLGFNQRTLEDRMGAGGVRFFSTGSTQTSWENGGREKAEHTTTLPWISALAYKERQGKDGRDKKRTNHSLWEDSAQRYFSRNNRNSPNTVTEEERTTENEGKIGYGKEDRGVGTWEESHPHKRTLGSSRERPSREGSERSYFSREGSKLSKDNRASRDARVENQVFTRNSFGAEEEDRGGEEAVEVEEEDAEAVDDPRWDRIKSRYSGFIDRESRFEKPEVRRWNKQENWGRKTWKEATESSVPKTVGQGVYGVGPVLAALTVERREFYALYIQEGLDLGGNNRKKKDKKGVEKVLKLAEKMGLKVVEASKHDLNMVVDNRPHQGLVLDASPLEMISIKELERPVPMEGHKAPLWVALDEVTDPQNLGAIVRSSYFFGVEGIVLCAKNSAPLSGVVSKASAGSLELIELRSCKNMMQFLSSSTENGWRVLGGSISSRALPLNTVEAGVPTVLVLGSEGTGLRPLVERSCTQLIRIPGNMSIGECPGKIELEPEEMDQPHPGPELKSFLAVESLNVSVAAGVLLYHLVGSDGNLADTKTDIA